LRPVLTEHSQVVSMSNLENATVGSHPGKPVPPREVLFDFEGLFEFNPQPMWIFDLETLAFLEVNDAAIGHYGFSRDEFLHMTIKDIRPVLEVPRLLGHLERTVDNPRPYTSCWRHQKKDGTVIDSEVTWLKVVFSGRPAKVAIASDVTERKRTEAQSGYHSFLLATITDAVVACDVDFVLTGWNPAAETTYGWKAAEVLGRPAADFIVEDAACDWNERIRELVEKGRMCVEATHVRRNGARLRVEARATALTAASGDRVGYVSVNRDITERRRSEDVVRALLKQVVGAQEEERRRVARELHDDAAQTLAALLVKLRAVEEAGSVATAAANDLRVHVARALDGVQRIAKGLRPPALDDMGLAEALDRLGMDLAETHGLRVDTLAQLGEQRLPATVETTLYRIAQEALANVRKHACAKTVSIVIRRAPARVVLIIEDDGQGFDADRNTSTEHLGLLGMRERAALLGGTLLVESTPGSGTRIRVGIPAEGNP
jgi:PAS domain S-box-containing protein